MDEIIKDIEIISRETTYFYVFYVRDIIKKNRNSAYIYGLYLSNEYLGYKYQIHFTGTIV